MTTCRARRRARTALLCLMGGIGNAVALVMMAVPTLAIAPVCGPTAHEGLADRASGCAVLDGAALVAAAYVAELSRVPKRIAAWRAGHPVGDAEPLDPWGNPFVYRRSNVGRDDGYVLCTNGPDGAPGGGDDICAETRHAARPPPWAESF